MDYRAYEHALMLGFSEGEAAKIGEDAYLDNRSASRPSYYSPVPPCDICGAGDAVTKTNGYLVCSEECDHAALSKERK